jgi:hypothetical protein
VWTCDTYWVKVPMYFTFDGASVPKWAWPLLDATPINLVVPGLFHDYLVRRGAEVHWNNPANARPLTVELAAEIMDDIMIDCKIDEEDRERILMALKWSAFFYWQKKPMEWPRS